MHTKFGKCGILENLLKNESVSKSYRILKDAGKAFSARAISALIAFFSNVLIARILSPSESGAVFLALTITMGFGLLSVFGMDNTIIALLSPAWQKRDFKKIMAVSAQSLKLVILIGAFSTLFLLSIYIFSSYFINTNKVYIEIFKFFSFAIIPISTILLFSGLLKSANRASIANFIEIGSTPLLFITLLFTYSIIIGEIDKLSVVFIYLLSTFLTAVISIYVFYSKGNFTFPIESFSKKTILNYSTPLMLTVLLNYITFWIPSLFLKLHFEYEDISIYYISNRTALLISFILVSFNSIAAPNIASLFHSKKLSDLNSYCLKISLLMTIVSLPVISVFLLFPSWILSIFGDFYSHHSLILRIITFGQVINISTGPVGFLLMMTNNQKLMRNNVLFIFFLCLLLSVFLIKPYGLVGAALTTTICISLQNLIACYLSYKYLNINTLSFYHIFKYLFSLKNI